jgi:hypothetical protein
MGCGRVNLVEEFFTAARLIGHTGIASEGYCQRGHESYRNIQIEASVEVDQQRSRSSENESAAFASR